jgi:hypothetical protein
MPTLLFAVLVGTGVLNVQATPPGRVFVDGVDHGTTPLELRVKPGEYEIRLERDDGKKRTVMRRVEDGKTTVLRVYW